MLNTYFDNGSTSFPKAPGVGEAMAKFINSGAVNINRGSYMKAYELAGKVIDTRIKLAGLFDGENNQVIFTSGITMSLNILIKSLLQSGDHVVVSSMEHNAVMRPLEQMTAQGIIYTCVVADKNGYITAEAVKTAILPETKLVIINHVSNVSGSVQPIGEIGKVCKQKGVFFAVDTSQSAGYIPISMKEMNIDFLGFTGHKGLLGPQGIGGFLISDRLQQQLQPLIAGGTGSHSDLLTMPQEMPDKYESGTMNLPGIVGLHKALEYIEEQGIENLSKKRMELTERFMQGIKEIKGVRVIGPENVQNRVAVISLDFSGRDNAEIAFALEQEYGIMTRVGLHCAPMAHKSLGTFPEGTVRISISSFHKEEDVDYLIDAIKNSVL